MFLINQPESNRPQFVIEQLDARRLLSVTVAAEEPTVDESTEVIEVTLDETVDEAVVLNDVLMCVGGDFLPEPASDEVEMYKFEEPIENLEDVPPADGEEFIRYTMMPGDNERNLDGAGEEGPNVFHTLNDGAEAEVEILVLEEDPGYVPGEEILYMTPPVAEPVADASSDLPPPPAAAAGLASNRGLFDSVIDSSDDDVLS